MSAHERRLYFQLQRTAHRLQKIADRALLAAAGITTAQAAVLAIVAGTADATQRDVARTLGINESAMTALATRLVEMGLIERHRSPDDPRAWRMRVTPEGTEAARRATVAFAAINTMIDAAMGEGGSAAMARDLDAIWRATASEL